jgi:hypothetical protein
MEQFQAAHFQQADILNIFMLQPVTCKVYRQKEKNIQAHFAIQAILPSDPGIGNNIGITPIEGINTAFGGKYYTQNAGNKSKESQPVIF